jgi:hypothetical protein
MTRLCKMIFISRFSVLWRYLGNRGEKAGETKAKEHSYRCESLGENRSTLIAGLRDLERYDSKK